MTEPGPIDVFIGYSQADTRYLEQLRKQLTAVERVGLVDAWHDGEIEVGSNREAAIRKAMNDSEIVILLISADFIASEFNYEKEMKWAMELHEKGESVVLPVILKDCTWKYAPFARLKVLPRGGIPVTDDHWKSTDRAFKQVVEEVIQVSKKLKGETVEEPPAPVAAPPSGKGKKGNIFNLRNGLIALLTLIVLFFFGSQIIGGSGSEEPDTTDTSQHIDQPSGGENGLAENHTKSREPLNPPVKTNPPAKQNRPADPPAKKQDAPKTQTGSNQPAEIKTQEIPQQPEAYEKPGGRINTAPPIEEEKEELEILPEPEPPKEAPKQYKIGGGMVTDLRDQKAYEITTINGKTWMRENLNLHVKDAYCPDNCAQVGRLYGFVLAQKVCPEGWRLPTKAEWKALTANQISHLELSKTLTGTKYRQQFLQAGQKGYYWSSQRAGGDESWAFEISQSGHYAVDRRYSFQGMHCRCVLNEE